jgi:tol-pal system protein YbgF
MDGKRRYTGKHLALVAPVLLAGCATTAEIDPVAVKLDDVDARLTRVEAVVNNQSLVELSRRIDTLEAQLRQLRGNTEETQNGAESLRKQQRDLYADLDRRLATLEAATKAAPVAVAGSTNAVSVAGDDQAAYTHAVDALKSGDYAAAITQLKSFAGTYPNSGLLDNAQYWLGEAYYVTRDYGAAATAFRTVGERWPSSRKAGDALLKLGFTQQEQKQPATARATLQEVVVRFPGTEAARLAKERLAKLHTGDH